ncbi:PAN2-PAN3 deadenylation complex subunit pan3-like [Haliotis asinina]|uniref:PAN2-PAN3 deadenylation complex subunit pan3-like n=1 Tax=Haliotis asinina TaxID=109174 RepID=UPI00353195E3
MTSAVPPGKKAALCRYYLNTGSCIYGDECQFLHQAPPGMQNSYSNGPSSSNGEPGLESMPNNGDQYFNATFGSIPEFQPFSGRQRPRSRNSVLGSLSQNAKPFVPAGPPGPPGPGGLDQNMANDFQALNLAGTPVPPGKGTPADLLKSAASLSHSSSTPSFTSYSSMFNTSTSSTPTSHIAASSVYSSASPNHSPGISPSGSPLTLRRTASPVAPLRQTTVPQKPQQHPQAPGGGPGGPGGPGGGGGTIQENFGGTTYFYHPDDFAPQYEGVQLPNFTMYPGLPPHIAHMKVKVNMPQFFMPDEIKMELLNRHALTLAQIDPTQNPDVPTEVDNYHNLFPLEPPPTTQLPKSSTFTYPTTCYKALNTKDGLTYCLRRVHGFRLANAKCMPLIDMWKKMFHPNIVQLKEVFTSKAFGDNSIIFVYDYFPGAETLMSRHFNTPPTMNGYSSPFQGGEGPPPGAGARPYSAGKGTGASANNSGMNGPRQHAGLLPESLIWTYVVQLSSALRAIHATGLACRALDPTKILVYSKSRMRLNCMGIMDVLTFDSNQANPLALIPHYQQEDLVALGRICLALACNNIMGVQRDHLPAAMDLVARNYSPDLKNLILYLLTNQNRPRSINDVMPMIGARFFTQLDAAQLRTDVLENELAKEVENGRLFRLLVKLGAINERPEFNMDPSWSETGDRYILKLFRDYLFHQVDESGAPWIDLAHVIQCVNKVDAGVPEKICLMSRDEQSILVVSYAEIKRCFESAFSELLNAGHQPSPFS